MENKGEYVEYKPTEEEIKLAYIKDRFTKLSLKYVDADKHEYWYPFLLGHSIERIRAIMEHVGLQEEFEVWHESMCFRGIGKDNFSYLVAVSVNAEILQTPTLLIQACISFMEGRDGH